MGLDPFGLLSNSEVLLLNVTNLEHPYFKSLGLVDLRCKVRYFSELRGVVMNNALREFTTKMPLVHDISGWFATLEDTKYFTFWIRVMGKDLLWLKIASKKTTGDLYREDDLHDLAFIITYYDFPQHEDVEYILNNMEIIYANTKIWHNQAQLNELIDRRNLWHRFSLHQKTVSERIGDLVRWKLDPRYLTTLLF